MKESDEMEKKKYEITKKMISVVVIALLISVSIFLLASSLTENAKAGSPGYEFLIYKESNITKAKNLTSGNIEFSSSDSAKVINDVFSVSDLIKVSFDNSTYYVNKSIRFISHRNVIIDGNNATIKANATISANFFTISKSTNITLKYLYIDINYKQTTDYGGLMISGGSNNITVEYCKVSHAGHGHIVTNHAYNILIRNNEVYSNGSSGDDGIIPGYSSYILVEGNYIHDMGRHNGVSLVNATHVKVINNTIINTVHGVALENRGSDVLIEGNRISARKCGIRQYHFIAGNAGYENVTIVRNDINATAKYGNGTAIADYYNKNWSFMFNKIEGGKHQFYISGKIEHLYINNNTFLGAGYAVFDNPYSTASRDIIIDNNYIYTPSRGIWLYSSNTTVESNKIIINASFASRALYVYKVKNITIFHNFLRNEGNNSTDGMAFSYNNFSSIKKNIIKEFDIGVCFINNDNYTKVIKNTMISNEYGIEIKKYSNDNISIYHNNFVNNTNQAVDDSGENITWNSSYPTGGNYWSDYDGTDDYSGSGQNRTGSDGIGDTPYKINGAAGSRDHYPLMKAADITDPTVKSTRPLNASVNVPISQNVIIVFNESMNTSVTPILTQTSGISTYVFAGWSSTNTANDTATWTHDNWPYNQTINLKVEGGEDLGGNLQIAYSWSFVTERDTIPPNISATHPDDGAKNLSIVRSNYSIKFSEEMNTSVNPSGNITTNLPNVTWVWNSDGVWLNGTYDALEYNKTYYVNLSANFTDLSGNSLTGDMQKNFTTKMAPDTSPPNSQIHPIFRYWQNSSISLVANASDNRGLANITLYYRYSKTNASWSNWTQFGNVTPVSGTSWSGAIQFTFPDGDGYYQFYTIAKDMASNTEIKAEADAICGYDSISPSINIDAPKDASFSASNSVSIKWEGADALSGIDYYAVSLDGVPYSDVGTVTSCNFTGLFEGLHIVSVKAIDCAGNENSTSVRFIVDTIPPEITIDVPSEGSLHRAHFRVAWHGSDSISGIERYMVKLDNGNWEDFGDNTTCDFENLTDGLHTIYVKGIDKAGNEAEKNVTFTVDATAPKVIRYSPMGNNVPVDAVIRVTFSEPMNHSSVRITVMEWRNNTAVLAGKTLSYGTEYLVYVTGSDIAGNQMKPYNWSFRTADMGAIIGMVVDNNKNPVNGALVILDGGRTTVTDSEGIFKITAPPGNYNLTVIKNGHAVRIEDISVSSGKISDIHSVKLPDATVPSFSQSVLPWLAVLVAIFTIILAMIYLKKKKGKVQHHNEGNPQEAEKESFEKSGTEKIADESTEKNRKP